MNPHFEKRGNFILVSVILAVLVLFSLYYVNGLRPIGSDATFKLKIDQGQGLKEISAALSQARIIRSISVFKLYAILTAKGRHFQPGVYQLNGRMSIPEIIKLLVKGGNQETSIVIPEGATLKEIDLILTSADVIAKNSLVNTDFKKVLAKDYPYLANLDTLEGFLYPDTYRFKINSSAEEVVKKFLDNFQGKIWSLIGQKNNWYQILTLASILEKEVPAFEDQQLVAGILNKRIKAGMPVQADATIAYFKCEGDLRSCGERQVNKNDLKTDSPYNTYLKLGLPPTPIANVSQSAVKAALSPKTSNYWYYLSADGSGKTIFSKTLEEQNQNRQKYL